METLGGFARHSAPASPSLRSASSNLRPLPAHHHPARFARPRAMVRADGGEGRRPEGEAGWEVGPESSAAPHAYG
jgi:hypothetical protein